MATESTSKTTNNQNETELYWNFGMVTKQIQPPTKPPLSSQQTAIDDDETGLKYDDDDETGTPEVIKLPHNLDEILKDADKQIDRSSPQKIYDQLSSGIYLKQKKQKFWVDKNLKNCFMSYARDFVTLEWPQHHQRWHWSTLKEQEASEASTFEAAELLDASWLCLLGKFETFKLSPDTEYEVVFILMIKNPSEGLHIPVNLTHKLHDKSGRKDKIKEQHHMETLKEKQNGIWIEIPVGVFTTSPHTDPAEFMEFCIHEWEKRNVRRKGLVVKGACIRPKMNP